MSKLLIVESPSKAKTISNYLGSEYKVLASYGHIRNLLPKSEGINTENFEMNFQLIDRNKKHMDAISKAVKDSDEVLLATDQKQLKIQMKSFSQLIPIVKVRQLHGISLKF